MPFVIAAGTTVDFQSGAGIQSVNLSMTPQIQRLYQLGNTVPYDRNIINQSQLNISRYAGQGSAISVLASASCVEPNPETFGISANGCSGGAISLTEDWFVTSYSYTKDVQGWGVESWSFISRPTTVGGPEPRMIRGVAEGQSSAGAGDANTGIAFIGSTVPGTTVEVSAGSPGIGRAFEMVFGEVSSVGGTSTGKLDGRIGTGSVSIPYAPIYV